MHRIGRVPKKDSGKPRPITDCSRPYGSALNDHIKNDLVSLLFLLLKFMDKYNTIYNISKQRTTLQN